MNLNIKIKCGTPIYRQDDAKILSGEQIINFHHS